MGAGMVSVINPILVALDDGWTYVVLGGLCVLVSPLLYVESDGRGRPSLIFSRRCLSAAFHFCTPSTCDTFFFSNPFVCAWGCRTLCSTWRYVSYILFRLFLCISFYFYA
jgi:hypothetical protein